jgi:hypothetical protein
MLFPPGQIMTSSGDVGDISLETSELHLSRVPPRRPLFMATSLSRASKKWFSTDSKPQQMLTDVHSVFFC